MRFSRNFITECGSRIEGIREVLVEPVSARQRYGGIQLIGFLWILFCGSCKIPEFSCAHDFRYTFLPFAKNQMSDGVAC